MRILLAFMLSTLIVAASCNDGASQSSSHSSGQVATSSTAPLKFTQSARLVLEETQYLVLECSGRIFSLSAAGQLQEIGMDDNIQRIADDVRNVTSHGDELAFQHGGVITVRNLTDGSQRNFDLSKWLPTTSESGSANGVQQLFISDTSILLDAELDKVQILMDRESEDTNTRPTRPLSEFKEYLLVGDSVLGVTNSIAQTSELEVTLWDGEQTLSTVFFHESGVGPNWPYFKHDPGGHYIYFADNVTYDWATNQSGLLLDGAERVLGNVYDPVSQRNWCWADGRIVNFMGGQQEVFARVSDDGAFLWVTYPWLLCVDKEMLRQYDIRSGELVRNLTMDVAEPAIWAMDGVLLENGSCYLNYFQKGVWKLPAMSAE